MLIGSKMNIFRLTIYLLALLLTIPSCQKKENARPKTQPLVSVTNTYLQSAVNDLTGNSIEVFCLAPPGMCPGHFDMSPEQIRLLLNSKILYRFDFQAGLDEKLNRMDQLIVPIQGRPGMSIPQTYLETCREIVPRLTEYFPDGRETYRQSLEQLEKTLNTLAGDIKNRIADSNLTGEKVITSHHQADFARWLGLNVVTTFKGADSMTPADIERCLKAGRDNGVQILIANLQEGTQLPSRMAEQLNARLVVFSNFPDTRTFPKHAFGNMLQSNIKQLIHQNR